MERRIEGEAGRKREPGGEGGGEGGAGRDREKEESSRNSIPRGVSDAQAAPACPSQCLYVTHLTRPHRSPDCLSRKFLFHT